RKIRIELDRSTEKGLRGFQVRGAWATHVPTPTLVRFPRVESFRWLPDCARTLSLTHPRNDRGRNRLRDFVLHRENVRQTAVVPLRPQVIAALCLDELTCNANPIAAAADTTFEHVTDTEFSGNLFHVDGTTFVGEAGVPRDDKKRRA